MYTENSLDNYMGVVKSFLMYFSLYELYLKIVNSKKSFCLRMNMYKIILLNLNLYLLRFYLYSLLEQVH